MEITDNLVKSTTQLRFELDKSKNELAFLLQNWELKKETSAGKITIYRANLKELASVMAAREEDYQDYQTLIDQNLALVDCYQNSLKAELPAENYNPDTAPIIQKLISETQAAEKAKTARISRAREVYKTQSDHIQRKSKEIYLTMKAEKENVEAYTIVLTDRVQALNEQLQLQIKSSGMGFGL
jgi:hypothetical protein